MSKRRVVVTGLGIVCPLGLSIDTAWRRATAGESGVRMIDHFDTSNHSTKFAGLVPDFDVTQYMSPKEARKCDMFIQYGIAAGMQAVQDAKLTDYAGLDKDQVGVVMGSGIGGIATIEGQQSVLSESGPRRITPFFIPGAIINMIAGHLSIQYGYRGPNLAVATACTTGTHAIGLAARSIAYGEANVMLAGGAEKASSPLGIAGFSAVRALSTRNDDPVAASRPWDSDRDGFVLGDGAGCVVLEEYEHAKARGAQIYAELSGFGMSGDAYHITRLAEGGAGGVLSMDRALKDAAINTDEVNYINAHGTSTPIGDVEESRAIETLFGEHAKQLSVSSTKSMTGHLLGAAGAIEAIFTILALHHQIAPPTINLDNQDPNCPLDFIPNQAREMPIKIAMSNSFGFGGTNGTVVFKQIS